MLKFLKTFEPEGKNNVEFSEFINETSFRAIQNEPGLFCKILEKNPNLVDLETVLAELKSPLYDLIDIGINNN